ncbi:MAG: hypothetical protein RIQ47_1885 [Bacteroidota bacterium]
MKMIVSYECNLAPMAKRTLIVSLLILFRISTSFGATFYSIANGTWSNSNIWSYTSGGAPCGATPIGSDYVVISHTVTLDKSLKNGGAGFLGGISSTVYVTTLGHLNGGTKYSIDVLSQGSLTVCGRLTTFNIEFFNGSVFNFCAGSIVQINGSFFNRNNSPNIQINGTVTVVGTFLNGTGAYIGGSGSIIVVNGPATNEGTIFECIGYYPCSSYSCLINSSCGNPVVLPVNWLGFSATETKDGVVLEWATAAEVNSSHFEIEYSTDAQNFERIATLTAAGNSSNTHYYSFTDQRLLKVNAYYRIRQVDFDGKFTFSTLEYVQLHAKGRPVIAPNPVVGKQFIINTNDNGPGNWSVRMYSSMGQLIFDNAGQNEVKSSSITTIDLPDYIVPGSYFIALEINNDLFYEQLVVAP